VWILGSKVLITEFVVDSTKYLIELVKQALFLQVYVDNIYGIINMFSLDKFLAMFAKYTPEFPYVAACLRDVNLGGSWARRIGRPAAIARMPGAMGDGNRDLVEATLDASGAFWVFVDTNTPKDKPRRMVPRHLVYETDAQEQAEQAKLEAGTARDVLPPDFTPDGDDPPRPLQKGDFGWHESQEFILAQVIPNEEKQLSVPDMIVTTSTKRDPVAPLPGPSSDESSGWTSSLTTLFGQSR
jgi:hypothetical protein